MTCYQRWLTFRELLTRLILHQVKILKPSLLTENTLMRIYSLLSDEYMEEHQPTQSDVNVMAHRVNVLSQGNN